MAAHGVSHRVSASEAANFRAKIQGEFRTLCCRYSMDRTVRVRVRVRVRVAENSNIHTVDLQSISSFKEKKGKWKEVVTLSHSQTSHITISPRSPPHTPAHAPAPTPGNFMNMAKHFQALQAFQELQELQELAQNVICKCTRSPSPPLLKEGQHHFYKYQWLRLFSPLQKWWLARQTLLVSSIEGRLVSIS
jgi:hypothetical protein